MITPRSPAPCNGRFAFLIHPTTLDDLYASAPAAFESLDPAQRRNWQRWIATSSERHYEPGIAYHLPRLHSALGGYAEGWLIAIPLTPVQMMHLRPNDRKRLMAECVAIAKNLRVDMLGLGAFTSIITRNGTDLQGCGVPVTTGNSLTALASAESLRTVARARGIGFERALVGVVGAAGCVGRLACKSLATDCTRLLLFGNPANPGSISKLTHLAGELYDDAYRALRAGATGGIAGALAPIACELDAHHEALVIDRARDRFTRFHDGVRSAARARGMQPPIDFTVDSGRDLPKAHLLLSATSNGKAFIDVRLLAHGAVVCDAARPSDVKDDLRTLRPDVFVYEGGLMRLPERVSFGRRNVIGCAPGVNLACLSETIVLTLAGVRRDYSIGTAPPYTDAETLLELARQHGFRIFVPGDSEDVATADAREAALAASAA